MRYDVVGSASRRTTAGRRPCPPAAAARPPTPAREEEVDPLVDRRAVAVGAVHPAERIRSAGAIVTRAPPRPREPPPRTPTRRPRHARPRPPPSSRPCSRCCRAAGAAPRRRDAEDVRRGHHPESLGHALKPKVAGPCLSLRASARTRLSWSRVSRQREPALAGASCEPAAWRPSAGSLEAEPRWWSSERAAAAGRWGGEAGGSLRGYGVDVAFGGPRRPPALADRRGLPARRVGWAERPEYVAVATGPDAPTVRRRSDAAWSQDRGGMRPAGDGRREREALDPAPGYLDERAPSSTRRGARARSTATTTRCSPSTEACRRALGRGPGGLAGARRCARRRNRSPTRPGSRPSGMTTPRGRRLPVVDWSLGVGRPQQRSDRP